MSRQNNDKEKHGIAAIWKNNIYALKTLFGPTPIYGISIIVEAIRHNLINFLEQTVCVFMVLDVIEKHEPYTKILIIIALFILLDIFAAMLSSLYENKIKVKYQPIAEKELKLKIYAKAKSIDIENYDNPEYYNDYCLVVEKARTTIDRAEQIVRMGVGSITALICYGTFFLTQDAMSVLFVLCAFALRTVLSNISAKVSYQLKVDSIPIERKRDYLRRVFYLRDYAKELRLNKKIGELYENEFNKLHDELFELRKKYVVKKCFLEFSAKYLSSEFMLDIVYVLYLVLRAALFGLISFSQVVVLYNSAAGLRRGLSTVAELGPYALETSLYVERIQKFLKIESKIANSKKYDMPNKEACLECCHVSFGYSKDKLVLKDINLKVKSGEKIALVGYNGAGKTTLINLLLRLYDPTEGCILLNGKDIKDYDLEEYRNYIGVIFQNFQIYSTSVRNNVSMDDIKDNDIDVKKAIRLAGIEKKIDTLPCGIDTVLTKEFDDNGTELSGGEVQKLAVARAFYKNAGMLFLDEPSSALDPIAEYRLNETIKKIAKGKGVIFISHRLSVTKNTDRILVMKDGQIIEAGSHNELLSFGGIYKSMWDAQASRYIS